MGSNVVIVGQGYVGLPLAVAAAEAGHDVTGVDLDDRHVDRLNGGTSPFADVTDVRLAAVIASDHYRATTSSDAVAKADIVVICVPTPYHNDAPDLSYVERAAASLAPHLRSEATVILESTTYPGTTEEVLRPVLEEGSGLTAGDDFHLVFSPERIDPGNEAFGIHNTPKIVGGTTERGTDMAVRFYSSFVERVIPVSGPKTAEMAKLLENTFRHINIALVNELAVLSREPHVDVWEVIEAASSKPFGFMAFRPGPGVGGHCIPVDPMYLSWRVRQFGGAAKFIDLARDVNAAMPLYCVERVQDLLNERGLALRGAKVFVLGVAYKRDISDLRESPALVFLERLLKKHADVSYHDPHVPVVALDDGGSLSSVDLDAARLAASDCVVLITDHSAFDLDQVVEHASLVFDTRNVVPARPHVHRLWLPGIAVVGAGQWGRNLVRNFAELGALRAVCDTDASLAAAIADEHDVATGTLDDVLTDPAIRGVVVASPAATHAELALRVIDAGRDVFVEKPLALTVADAERVADAATAAGVVLMVGHLLQYHPAFERLLALVRGGEVGRIQYLYSNRLNLGRFRREENILWSLAPHDISMILSLVGSAPSKVEAVGGAFLHATRTDVTTTHLTFPAGEQAHVYVSWLHPFKEQKLVVIGDRGMAVLDDGEPWDRKFAVFEHRVDWRDGGPEPVRAEPRYIEVAEAEPLREECRHFLDRIADRGRPRTDGAEGVAVLRVLADAERSITGGAPVGTAGRSDAQIHETAAIDQPSSIGAGTRIWHFSHVLAGSTIGRRCTIGQNVVIGPDVQIGDDCRIQNNVSVFTGVTLEDGVFCGPSCVFTNVLNPRATVSRKDEFRPTVVRRGATIGANATVVCGVEIGAYAMVGAGAVVTTDVAPHALVVGVPARRTGWVSHDGEVLGDDLRCPRSGQQYVEVAPDELKLDDSR